MDESINNRSIIKDFYGVNLFGLEEISAVEKVISSKSPFRYYGVSKPEVTENFEKECCSFFSREFCHILNSCTGALSCALHALDVGIGDEVVMPGYFWIAMANTTLLRGAIPVLVEIKENFYIDLDDLISKITDKTKCVIVPHMDGIASNICEIIKTCKSRNVKIIEDFSQSLGASISGKQLGAFGDISVASFQINKVVTAGEGGIFLTDNEEYYRKCTARSDFGYSRSNHILTEQNDYLTTGEGRRINELSSSILQVQLSKATTLIKRQKDKKRALSFLVDESSIFQMRCAINDEEDNGTTMSMIFKNSSIAKDFIYSWHKKGLSKICNIFLLEDFGQHVYFNCAILTEKIPSLPPNFPWDQTDREYNYTKGELKKTDILLSKTVLVKLSANLSDLDMQIIGSEINRIINHLETQKKNS